MWLLVLIFAYVPLIPNPVWEGGEGYYSTGGALSDVDRDGDLDFLVSNGNDMHREPNHIFFNLPGGLETTPSWVSSDHRYSGHLAVGDLDSDGYPDLVVATLIGIGWTYSKSVAYHNLSGSMEDTPFWIQGDSSMTFSCALGDINGDGSPDLILASGNRYDGDFEPLKVYLNIGGTFDTLPSWESAELYSGADVALGDVNRDGLLDVFLANDGGKNALFLNLGDSLESHPSWQSRDQMGTLQAVLGDIDNDGWIDLIVADNAQLSGESRVAIYLNHNGVLDTLPSWTSQDGRNYYSTVALADLDGDGDLEIGAGGWWEPVVVFENHGGTFNPTPEWSWSPSSWSDLVCEKVTFGRVTNHPVDTIIETFSVPFGHRVFYLSKLPFEEVLEMSLNDTILPPSEYSTNPEEGFIVLGTAYDRLTGTLEVQYTATPFPDLTVTNWAPSRGNFLFLNEESTEVRERQPLFSKVDIFPNPTRGEFYLKGINPLPTDVQFYLLDASGRVIRRLTSRNYEERMAFFIPRELGGGLYFLRIKGAGEVKTLKLIYLPRR